MERRQLTLRRYTLKTDHWGISKYRQRELEDICRQYDEMRAKLDRIRSGADDPGPRPGNTPGSIYKDQTARRAIAAAESREARRIEAIEQAAVAADPELFRYILASVTRGISYERMSVPCGRRQFYDARSRFFWELDRRI